MQVNYGERLMAKDPSGEALEKSFDASLLISHQPSSFVGGGQGCGAWSIVTLQVHCYVAVVK